MSEISASASPAIPKNLLDTAAVAEILGITPGTLRKWRCKGIGPAYVRLSHSKVRYRVVDLDKWIKSCLIGGSSRA